MKKPMQIIDYKFSRLPVLLALCFPLATGISLQAADITWSGSVVGDEDNWATAGNWIGGSAPTSSDNVILDAEGVKEIYLGSTERTINQLTFDSEISYTLRLQEIGNTDADKYTRLRTYGITVVKGDHKIYGRPVTATEGTDKSVAVLRQSLRLGTSNDNDNEFIFDIAKNASLDLDVRLQTSSPATAYKRGEGTLIISLNQDGSGSTNFPHTAVGGLFEVQNGTLRIDTTGAEGFSRNDWSVDGGTLELTKNFGGSGRHLTLKGSGYQGNGAIHASQSVTLDAGIVYLNSSAAINVDAGKILTISKLITDQRQYPDGKNKHTGLAPTGGLTKIGNGIINITTGNTTVKDSNGTDGDGDGANNVILQGNHYAGGTLIQAGTILANNTSGSATGSGTVTVNGGDAGLGGTGAIGGELVVSNGWVSAGATGKDSYGKLTVEELSMGSSGKLFVDLKIGNTTAGTGYDQLLVGDTVSLGGLLSLNIDDSAVTDPGDLSSFYGMTYFLIDNQGSSSISGNFQGRSEGDIFVVDGYYFELTYLADAGSGSFDGGNDLAIRMVPIPEPSALILALAGCVLPLSMRRR